MNLSDDGHQQKVGYAEYWLHILMGPIAHINFPPKYTTRSVKNESVIGHMKAIFAIFLFLLVEFLVLSNICNSYHRRRIKTKNHMRGYHLTYVRPKTFRRLIFWGCRDEMIVRHIINSDISASSRHYGMLLMCNKL